MTQMTDYFGRSPTPPGAATDWGARYAMDLREVIVRQAHRMPRTVQRRLGPSELGAVCDRQVVSKLIEEPVTNHTADPWASVVGTGVHAILAQFFENENALNGELRWLTEKRVSPHPDYPGTSDVYDVAEKTVVDWKLQGPTSQAKTRRPEGPPQRYVIQLLLYAWGWRNAGFEVERVALASMPRTASRLSEMYLWDHWITPEDDAKVIEILQQTEARRWVAQQILNRNMTIGQVPRTPGSDECHWCNYYRSEAAADGDHEHGCPGHSAPADWPAGVPYPPAA